MKWLCCLALALGIAGCGDDDGPMPTPDAGSDEDAGLMEDSGPPDAREADSGPPDAGSGPCVGPPGLYSDEDCTVISDGLRPFQPRYQLWSDGADKERYVFLPDLGAAGSQIDTTDPDHWTFPVGTIFFKTFLRDGLRIETRILEKTMEGIGPDYWTMRVFAWDMAQRNVEEVTDGVTDALGTTHDIPPQVLCRRCHMRGSPDVGLGFSAIQLNHADSGADTGVTLQDLLDEARLTVPFDPSLAEVPDTRSTPSTGMDDPALNRAALGYLHANCGQCHGGSAPQSGLDMWVNLGLGYVEDTGTWMTAVDQPSAWTMGMAVTRIRPGAAMESTIFVRMGIRPDGMPPIATEYVDETNHAVIGDWIESLAP